MADKRISGLPALTSTSKEDILLVVDDPAGTPTNRKISIENFFSNVEPQVVFANTLEAGTTNVASVVFKGGISVNKSLIVAGDLEIRGNTKQVQAVTVNSISSNLVPTTDTSYTLGDTNYSFKNVHVRSIHSDRLGTLYVRSNTTNFTSNIVFDGSYNVLNGSTLNVNSNTIFNANVTIDSDVERFIVQSSQVDFQSDIDFLGSTVELYSNVNSRANIFTLGALTSIESEDLKVNANSFIVYGNTTIGGKVSVNNPKGFDTANLYVAVTNAHFDANSSFFGTTVRFEANVINEVINYQIVGTNTHISANTNIDGHNFKVTNNTYFTGTNLEIRTTNTVITSSTLMTGPLKLNDTTQSTTNTTGSLILAGGLGVKKNVTIGGNLLVFGNLTAKGTLTLGDETTDSVSFGADLTSDIVPDADDTYNLGTSAKAFSNVYVYNISAVGSNVYLETSNAFLTANLTVIGSNSDFSSNMTFTGTNSHFTSNVSVNASNVYLTATNTFISGTDTQITANLTLSGSNTQVNTGNAEFNANVTIKGTNTVFTSNTTFRGSRIYLTSNTTLSGEITDIISDDVSISSNIAFTGTDINLPTITSSSLDITANVLATGSNLHITTENTYFTSNTSLAGSLTDILSNDLTVSSNVLATGSNLHITTENTYFTSNTSLAGSLTDILSDDLTVSSNVSVNGSNINITVANTFIDSNTTIIGDLASIDVTDLDISSNITLTGTNTHIISGNTYISSNVYINSTDLTIDSNTVINSANLDVSSYVTLTGDDLNVYGDNTHITSNVTLNSSNLDVSSNVTLTGDYLNVYGDNTHITSNVTIDSANLDVASFVTLTGDYLNVYGDNTHITSNTTIDSANLDVSSYVTLTGDDLNVYGDNTHITSNTTIDSTNLDVSSNVTLTAVDLNVYGDNTHITSNVTIDSSDFDINSINLHIYGDNTHITSNVTIDNTDTEINSNVSITNSNVFITSDNTYITSNVSIYGESLSVGSNVYILSTEDSTSNTTGSFVTDGGVGVVKSVTIGQNLLVHGNIHANGNITADGNLELGDEATDSITLNAEISSDIIPLTDSQYNLGSDSQRFSDLYIDDITVTGNVDITDSLVVSGSNVYITATNTFLTSNISIDTSSVDILSNVAIISTTLNVHTTDALVTGNIVFGESSRPIVLDIINQNDDEILSIDGYSSTIRSNAIFTIVDRGIFHNGLATQNNYIMSFGENMTWVDSNTGLSGTTILQDDYNLLLEEHTRDRIDTNDDGMTISAKNIGIGHVPDFGIGDGRNVMIFTDGVPPSITPDGQSYIYAKQEEHIDYSYPGNPVSLGIYSHIHVMDGLGNETHLGPHDANGDWVFYSKNIHTGRIIRINMIDVVQAVEQLTGETFIKEE